jgi:carboxylesterase
MVRSSIPLSARPTKQSRKVAEEFKRATLALQLPKGIKVGALLIHGLTGEPNEMKPLAQALEQLGCTVEVPLLPGHGASYKELLKTGWQDWLDGARQSLNKLSETCDIVVVGGLCLGGLLPVLLALENAKVAGIVSLSPTIRYDGIMSSNWVQMFIPLVDLYPSFLGRKFYWTETMPFGLRDERLQRIIQKQFEAAGNGKSGNFRKYAGSLRQLDHLLKQIKKHAGEVTCPALIMHSMEDSVTGPYNPKTLHSWLSGTQDKSITWLQGCDHVLPLDLKKEEVAYHYASFVCRIAAAKASRFAQPQKRSFTRSSLRISTIASPAAQLVHS